MSSAAAVHTPAKVPLPGQVMSAILQATALVVLLICMSGLTLRIYLVFLSNWASSSKNSKPPRAGSCSSSVGTVAALYDILGFSHVYHCNYNFNLGVWA
jgi:hypothetical protein